MAIARRPDGAEIHWHETGGGPLVVLSTLSYSPPEAHADLVALLAVDHRVVTYDLRGCGESSGPGPFSIDVDAGDLEAVAEAAGGAATVVAMGDGCNRAIRAAVRRPDLFQRVVASGAPGVGSGALGEDSLAGSQEVLRAFLRLFDSDYSAAVRSAVASGGMDEQAARERVEGIVAYAPHAVALERMRAWIAVDDRGLAEARALGGALVVLHHDRNPWFAADYNGILRGLLPDAEFVEVEDGALSRPDLTAEAVRARTL